MKKKKKRNSRKSLKRVTSKGIASRVGVSVMTVSRALNNRPYVGERTRRRILKVAKEFGYSPNHIARSLVMQRTETLGVVVPEISHSFFPEVIKGIEQAAYSAGYHLILTHSAEDEAREKDVISTLESKRVDGLLISTAQTVTSHKTYLDAIRMGTPIVFYDRVVTDIGASCVGINDEECCYMVTDHLAEHGYKAIAHLCGPASVSIGRDRLKGYRKSLSRRGLKLRPDLVIRSGFSEEGGYAATQTLLRLPQISRPDAIVAVNDLAAFGAMRAIAEHKLRIPEDIAIVGMGDVAMAAVVSTPLTTIQQPAFEIGKTAAETLISEVEGRTKPGKRIIIGARLAIRKSCGCS